jgi:hypothetical protein
MKALSFRQPWAELILRGRKTMDLRTYSTTYRGPLAVHASQKVEREACGAHGLAPDTLETGGVVGVVELVDILPLTAAEYETHRDEHLAGRRFREPMFGWVLASPRRLPQVVPARGRMSLFNVDLEGIERDEAKRATSSPNAPLDPRRRSRVYEAHPPDDDPERPFTLYVKPLAGASTSYALTLAQKVLERDQDPLTQSGRSQAARTTIVSLNGDNLKAVADHVIEALRQAGYKATDLSPHRTKPFLLPEPVGVRLGLVFLAVKPLSKLKRVEAISHGIRQMPLEEAYYWYSKCTAVETADRAQKALRVLLAAE